MKVLPEKRTEVVQTILSMSGPMEKEPGCRSYLLIYDMSEDIRVAYPVSKCPRKGL